MLEQQQEREQLQWGVDSKLRILAADDNNKVLDLLDKDLSALGLSVSTCSRRGELRQLLEQQPFDVLAIDESPMSSSGVDLCMAIRGRYPGMTRIVMTNAPTRGDRGCPQPRRHRRLCGKTGVGVHAAGPDTEQPERVKSSCFS